MSGSLTVFEALPSTSDYLLHDIASRASGSAILAMTQTKGRGSRGRGWISAGRSLNLSVLHRRPADELPWLGYAASLAFLQGISAYLPANAAPSLKWPNDIMVAGRKLGGLLVDAVAVPGGAPAQVVFGFGANLEAPPAAMRGKAVSIAELGGNADPVPLAKAVLAALAEKLALLPGDAGRHDLVAAWLARAHPVGTVLHVSHGDTRIRGEFAGIAADGGLRLAIDGRERIFYAGFVVTTAGE